MPIIKIKSRRVNKDKWIKEALNQLIKCLNIKIKKAIIRNLWKEQGGDRKIAWGIGASEE